MAALKTYTISTDVIGGAVNSPRLHTELDDSGDITNFTGINITGDSMEVCGDSFVSEANVDATVLNHVAVTLDDNKATRIAEVRAKTSALLAVGFTYDSNTFPATSTANFNYEVIRTHKTDFVFPKNISTLNGTNYALAEVDVDAFWTAAKDFVEGILDGQVTLLNDIVTAVDQAALDAVVDNR